MLNANSQEPLNKWVIGGASRAGKTSFLNEVAKHEPNCLSITVDALLYKYINDEQLLKSDESVKKFIYSYLNTPRYINPERTATRKPMDDVSLSSKELESVIKKVKAKKKIHALLEFYDLLALEENKTLLALGDLHSEFYYDTYLKIDSSLNLLVFIRDPRESCAASLYWRTYPKRNNNKKKGFRYYLFLWMLSSFVTKELSAKYSNKVFYFSEYFGVARSSVLPFNKEMFLMQSKKYFSMNENNEYLCPDYKYQKLLKEDEELYILKVVSYFFKELSISVESKKYINISILPDIVLLKLLFYIAKNNSCKSKNILDLYFYPTLFFKKKYYSLRGLIREIIRNSF